MTSETINEEAVNEEATTIESKRIMLTVAYDGTAYRGWQYQPKVPTIEGELKGCLAEILGHEFIMAGGSRTDTGVHALGNIAVFDTTSPIAPEKIAFAMNRRLPDDIRVQKSEEVAADFHPRKVPSRKVYEYRIWNAPIPLPTLRLYRYHTHQQLDVAQMDEAAAYLVGEHDFTSFCAVGSTAKTMQRTIHAASVTSPASCEVVISVIGGGFLYNMVRIIAGTLLEVGVGRYPPAHVAEIIEAKDRCIAGPTAPAHGLFLIGYQFDPF